MRTLLQRCGAGFQPLLPGVNVGRMPMPQIFGLPQKNIESVHSLEVGILGGNRQSILQSDGSNPNVVCWNFLPEMFQMSGKISIMFGCGFIRVKDGCLAQKFGQSLLGFFRFGRFLKTVPQLSQNGRTNEHIGVSACVSESIKTPPQMRHNNTGVKKNADHFVDVPSASGVSSAIRRPNHRASSMARPSVSSTLPKVSSNVRRRFSRAWGFFRKNSSQTRIRSRGDKACSYNLAMSVNFMDKDITTRHHI